jgi:two-component system invasion response regulator UvrY
MNSEKSNIKIVLADDHELLRSALASLIESFGNCKVLYHCGSGTELVKYLQTGALPDIAVLDLSMPGMNGLDTANWLKANLPSVHVLMLTMYDSEFTLINLLRAGVKGFLKKDVHPDELKSALQAVMQTGFYYSNHTTGKLINLFRNEAGNSSALLNAMLSDEEMKFLKLLCTDMTYKEIAGVMKLNPRSLESMRDQLFIKFDVKSRVGLAMIALRNGIEPI